jgi:hypothetical protein
MGGRMSGLVVFAAIASIAATALLTLVLYRMNAPAGGASQRKDGGGEAGYVAPIGHDDGSGEGGGDGGGD